MVGRPTWGNSHARGTCVRCRSCNKCYLLYSTTLLYSDHSAPRHSLILNPRNVTVRIESMIRVDEHTVHLHVHGPRCKRVKVERDRKRAHTLLVAITTGRDQQQQKGLIVDDDTATGGGRV